ncbi:MAG: PKD domain-containing protein [Bacteroidota bacterium]
MFTNEVQAAHIVGGEMTYECLGPEGNNSMRYRFTMKVYRDCAGNGADYDGPDGQVRAHITVYQGSSINPFTTVFAGRPRISRIEADIGINNPCIIVPTNVCVQEGIYIFEEVLPIVDESYHIVYQRCCRNGSISNLRRPGETGSSYTVEISPLAQRTCNNSPTFKQFPPIVICADQELIFDHSATDAEGDQLVYSFCTPLNGGTTFDVAPNPDAPPPWQAVRYVPPYSGNRPITGAPDLSITPNTGIIRGVPTIQGQFVVGICVQEFRNGDLLTELRRDFQFNVTFCEPQVNATISGDLDAGVYRYQTCNETVITMINRSTNVNFIDSYLWQFNTTDRDGNPLVFDTRNIVAEFPGPGKYSGRMILNPGSSALCTDTADVEVVISPPIEPQFIAEYDTCVAGSVSFQELTPLIENGVASWNWDFGDQNTSNEQNPVHRYQTPGLREVSLTIVDSFGCSGTFTQEINWFPAPAVIILEPSAEVGCAPLEVTFNNLSEPIDETYNIRWNFGDGNTGTEISPTHVYTKEGFQTVTVEILSPLGCYNIGVFEDLIEVDSSPVVSFNYTPEVGISNFNPTVQFFDQSKHIVQWDWDFGGLGSSGLISPSFTFPDTGRHVVTLTGTHFYGCVDTFSQVIDVVPLIRYFLPNAFTPNGDDKNEFFGPKGFFRGIRNYQMVIYNRWGELIFETTNPDERWNGRKFNTGRSAPSGAYAYHISFVGPRGTPQEFQGTAILVR